MQIDLLFLAVALFGVCFPIYLVRKSRLQDDDNSGALSLSAPLLANSSDHRLDAALRDAEEGYNRCNICGFENFKRFSSCSICGDSVIESHAEFVDRMVRNTSVSISVSNSLGPTSRPRLKHSETKSLVKIVTPHSKLKQGEPPIFTERQLRARKRKEWTRKLDIKGEVYWYRDGLRGAVDLRYPGFVVQFQRKRERRTCYSIGDVGIDELVIQKYPSGCSSTDSMGEPEPALSPQSQLESEQRGNEVNPPCKPGSLTVEHRMQELEDETLPIEIKLTDATVVDASRMPLDCTLPTSSLPWREVLRVASRSFPTKYAHFVTSTAALIMPPEKEIIRFNLNRVTLFKDSIESLSIIPAKNIRSVMRIKPLDGAGIDAGGLHREWFVLLNEQLIDPENSVFRCVNKCDQTFYFNSNSAHDIGVDHLVSYFATGRLIGRALLEGQVLGFHLALPLLKIVLGIPIAFTDLEYFDPELFKSLTWMIDHDVDALGLDFSVTEKRGNDFVVVDLIRNGRNIDVTDDNKDFYLERRFMHLLFESVSSQIYVFLKGLYEVIPQKLLMLFNLQELDYLLCGSDEIDVDDWEKHTQYSEELLHHPALAWFWEIVREVPNECRRRLLQFATGSSRVPIAGFSALTSYDGRLCPFTLKGVKLKDDGYIWGHACFNRLDLPLHTARDELRVVMYAAIETEMYGFTTN